MRSGPEPGANQPASLVASATVTSAATAPEGAAPQAAPSTSGTPPPRLRLGADAAFGFGLAVGLGSLAFTTTGGFDVIAAAGDTWSEIAIMVVGAAACAAVVLFGARARHWGGATVALFAALSVLTGLSIFWSVQPDHSWQSSTQTLAYLAAFAGAAALGRLVPERWPAVIGAIATTAAGLCGYALLAKVFPALDAGDVLGRLQSPFQYWNAIGAAAAVGVVPCLWAGTRRAPGKILPALAPAGLALLVSVVVLSFSRSAVLVTVLALACWLAVVPLRLRSAAILALGGAGAAVISTWALATHAITGDRVALSERTTAGHAFGIVIVITLLLLVAAGAALAIGFERVSLSSATRRRIGTVLVGLVCLVPFLGIGVLATSSRGLTGEVSHYWSTLTSPNGGVGDNAGRLLQLGNSRPLYWQEGLKVGEHALLAGVGAEGFATAHTVYATSALPVSHAHSYVIETFADLGLIGVALSLALLVAWCIAAARPLAATTPWRELAPERAAERAGMVALGCVVVAFGVQSAIDWTWFFTGIAVPVLICAGWLAGRGPLLGPVGRAAAHRPILQRPGAAAALTGLAAITLALIWFTWQPLRSADALSASLSAAASGDRAPAFTDARESARIDPVSIEPLQILSSLYLGAGDVTSARQELVDATQRQPENPESWLALGGFELQHGQIRRGYRSLLRTLRLDPLDGIANTLAAKTRAQLGLPPPKG